MKTDFPADTQVFRFMKIPTDSEDLREFLPMLKDLAGNPVKLNQTHFRTAFGFIFPDGSKVVHAILDGRNAYAGRRLNDGRLEAGYEMKELPCKELENGTKVIHYDGYTDVQSEGRTLRFFYHSGKVIPVEGKSNPSPSNHRIEPTLGQSDNTSLEIPQLRGGGLISPSSPSSQDPSIYYADGSFAYNSFGKGLGIIHDADGTWRTGIDSGNSGKSANYSLHDDLLPDH